MALPTPTPPAMRPRAGASVAAGILLLLFGLAVVSWMIYDFKFSRLGAGEFLQALFDPRIRVEPELFSPQVWALTVVLLTLGVMAAAQRPGARGGALFAAWVMLVVSLRELAGLAVSDQFRDRYLGADELDALIIGSWVVALVISVTVLILLLPAGPDAPPAIPGGPLAAGGALLLFIGVLGLAWIGRELAGERYQVDAKDYFRHLVDASHGDAAQIGGSFWLYQAVFTLAMLVLGVLALTGRPVARSAAVTLAAVVLYLDVRHMIGLTLGTSGGGSPGDDRVYPSWSDAGADLEGKLSLASTVGEAVICVVVIAVMAAAGRRALAAPPSWQPQYPQGGYTPYTPNPYQPPPQDAGFGPPPSYPPPPGR